LNQFGERIKQFREFNGLLQRELAVKLGIDTPMLSKIEHGERRAKREHVAILSNIFKLPLEDLLSLWLADKVFEVLKDEDVALKAIEVAEEELKTKRINK